MKKNINFYVFLIFFGCSAFVANSQVNTLELNTEKEAMFNPYMYPQHGGIEGLKEFKKNEPYAYLKELWYYSESFYIRRDYLEEGVYMNESMIDITRFESNRKETEEAIVILPGFKDVLVLLPNNKLIYKPAAR